MVLTVVPGRPHMHLEILSAKVTADKPRILANSEELVPENWGWNSKDWGQGFRK